MAYAEARFGEVAALGTGYTSLGGPVPSATKWNVLINATNLTAAETLLRVYIADTSWSTGEPTGGTLVVEICHDMPIAAGETIQITGIIVEATEELVVRASVASSVAISAHGVAIT